MAEPIASNTEPHLTTEEEMKQAQINLKLQAANARAEKAERSLLDDHVTLMLRAEKAERERDQFAAQAGQLRDLADTVRGQRDEAERERDTLRAELARLTASGEGSEGEPSDAELRRVADDAYVAANGDMPRRASERALYRLGVAHERARQATDPRMKGRTLDVMLDECEDLEALEQDAYVAPKSREGLSLARKIAKLYAAAQHAEARQQPVQDRATDEELFEAYDAAYFVAGGGSRGPLTRDTGADHVSAEERAGILAVAAHVRKECLVAQAVGMGCDLTIEQYNGVVEIGLDRPKTDDDEGEHFEGALVERRAVVTAADVPATLARLLGEVSK